MDATKLNVGLDLRLPQQLRQLGDIRRNPPRLTMNREMFDTNIRPTTVARRTDSRNRYRNTQLAADQ
jgi:hypothetical protein